MASITLSGLTKTFGTFTAVKSLDLHIADKEFLALLGPSGCGKSTTMNIIAGMEQPSAGTVRFDDRDMLNVPMGRRGVGFVFQNYAIFTHMSVYDNIAYGLRMRGLPKAEIDARVRQVAELLGLTPFLKQKSAGLSVNILQRLAIGRSAAVNPQIFLLDEPLSNVDAAFRAVMRTELKHLQREFGQTMIYVTHDQLEAMTMADRIAVMDRGVLQQVGSPIEVYNNPVNTFVARFLGSPSMNLLPARLGTEDGRPVVEVTGLGRVAAPASARGSADVLFGIRPEDLTITATDLPGAFVMEVVFVERVGPRTIVHLARDGQELKAIEGNGFPVAIGDRLGVVAKPESVRLFDAATGQALDKEPADG
ncbi:ABC transporter ATP-binding protein [Microbaculum marinum]|uniref:ABC transporter ATP-binding protein n=1 Tax=Microbaculum marinum TaxID=1764581 RepID=A0AAW9RK98_9HYPH